MISLSATLRPFSLPQKQKDEYLVAFIAEPANVVRSKLLKGYRASQATPPAATAKSPPRTAAELRAAAGIE